MKFWLDMYWKDGKAVGWGIETTDKDLTFDGHYVCVFYPREGEEGLHACWQRADTLLRLLEGE